MELECQFPLDLPILYDLFSRSLNLSCSFGAGELQAVDAIETARGPRYFMGRMDQKNLAMVVRFD